MFQIRRLRLWVVAAATTLALSGCGWIAANGKSSVKPDGFVLFGHAAVTLPSNDHRAPGTACSSPVNDVTPGTAVRVLDPSGNTLGITYLGDGVVGRASGTTSCNFPFSLSNIAGGVDSYRVVIGTRPARQFASDFLRQNNAAVITISG